MSRRRRALLAVALLAGAAVVAAVALLGTSRGDRPARSERVNETEGRLRGVRFGASAAQVRAALGKPTDDGQGFFPEGADFTGPPAIPAPSSDRGTRVSPETLHYQDAAYLVSPTAGVFAMAVLAEGAETRAGVRVGDSLERVRERYSSKVDCGEAAAGESLFGGDPPTYPWCRTRIGDLGVFFGEDPIESITLTRRS